MNKGDTKGTKFKTLRVYNEILVRIKLSLLYVHVLYTSFTLAKSLISSSSTVVFTTEK